MPRFFVPQALAVGLVVTLPEAVAHHLHVVRMAVGDPLTVFNGEGGEFAATLTAIDRKRASAELTAFVARDAELPFALTLAQALPEGGKMDWIVEKAVELGVAAIAPLTARRCVTRLGGERAEKKLAHWRGVVEAACEQCGRNRLTQVAPIAQFDPWIVESATPLRVLFSPRADLSLTDWARQQRPQAICLLVGPEGGFTDEEEASARAHGALTLSLGPRVLRTETAGLCAAAALGALWGGM